ncbi:MAG TPA: hypothetical protein VN788_06650 [Verrucomicrobiae bacterium]|nr:hypothetical protein [Verrucomicrobiae bacterium]
MKKILLAAIAVSCLAGAAVSVRAQDENAASPPKVLVVTREMVKIGKGAAHTKNEAAWVRAAMAAKEPDRYLAATTMTGPNAALFFEGFDSYAAWGEADKFDSQPKVTALTGPMAEKDADYVSEGRQMVATLNEKWSWKPGMNIAEMRYFELETIRMRPGHDREWDELIALYQGAATKMNLDEHDIFYEVHYGAPAGTVLIFTPRKSLGDLDAAMGTGKAFQEALGEKGREQWGKLVEETVAADSTELLSFSPEMSYPPDEWVKSDPSYWKSKPMGGKPAAAAKKGAEAPAPKE